MDKKWLVQDVTRHGPGPGARWTTELSSLEALDLARAALARLEEIQWRGATWPLEWRRWLRVAVMRVDQLRLAGEGALGRVAQGDKRGG